MAKKDHASDHGHQGLDHRREFYGYTPTLHGFEQYYSADFQAQVTLKRLTWSNFIT